MWKIQQAMQDDAIRTARIPWSCRSGWWSVYKAKFPACLPRFRFEKPRSREPSQPALSYEHIENVANDLEVRRDLGNRAHLKRPFKLFINYGAEKVNIHLRILNSSLPLCQRMFQFRSHHETETRPIKNFNLMYSPIWWNNWDNNAEYK